MRLGIDFGTTRIVVAAVDRGNYPVVTFEDQEGHSRDWFPPLIAVRGNERLYGWDAWAAQGEAGLTMIRSIKRDMEDAGPDSEVELAGARVPMRQLLDEMVGALKGALLERSSVRVRPGERLEIMLGVPANANSNQRFLTVDPFQRAGFQVLGLLNEPSAASIEYGHRSRGSQPTERVLVYDLGGGTFDASLVDMEGNTHVVVASEGVSTLGGDDFDILLAELALERAGIGMDERESLTQGELFRLHDECREKKEALHPNTKRILIDLAVVRADWSDVQVPADEYYARCRPLVEQTIEATRRLLDANDHDRKLEAVYLTGGGSELPIVARMLREVYGRRVQRSPYTRSATAIGLAIQADAQAGYVLREKFTRHFGVWREAEGGRSVVFDSLFPKGTALPGPDEPAVTLSRSYWPVHNVGHFRYLECSHRGRDGNPTGDIAVWDEIRFPFDPGLRDEAELAGVAVDRKEDAAPQNIEERYFCQSDGSVNVIIRNLTSGYERRYRLGRWAGKDVPIVPGKKPRKSRTRVDTNDS